MLHKVANQMTPPEISRKIRASYGWHEAYPVDQADAEYLEKLIRRGFPRSDIRPHLHYLASARRKCEFLESGDSQHLILDWELISTIAQMDSLALTGADPGDLGTMHAFALFGDEFAHRASFQNYHYIFQRLHPDSQHLRDLAQCCHGNPIFSRSAVFITLHELAHVTLRKHPEHYRVLDALVDAAVQRFTAATARIKNEPQILQDWSHISGVSDAGTLREGLQRDLPKYTHHLLQNTDLRDELKCDLAALLANINIECNVDLFENLVPAFTALDLQKAGDCLMMGARTLKGLQTVKSVSAITDNLEEQYTGEFLKEPLIMSTARNNIVVFLASFLLDTWVRQSPSQGNPRVSAIPQSWLDTFAKFLHCYGLRVLDPIELLETFFADSPSVENAVRSLEARFDFVFSSTLESKVAGDRLRFTDLPLARPL